MSMKSSSTTNLNNQTPISFSPILNNSALFTPTSNLQQNQDVADYFSTDLDFDTAYMLITNETSNHQIDNSNNSSIINLNGFLNNNSDLQPTSSATNQPTVSSSSNSLNSVSSTSTHTSSSAGGSLIPLSQSPSTTTTSSSAAATTATATATANFSTGLSPINSAFMYPPPKNTSDQYLRPITPDFLQLQQQQQQQNTQQQPNDNNEQQPHTPNQDQYNDPNITRYLFEQQRNELLKRPPLFYQSPKTSASALFGTGTSIAGSPVSPNTRNVLTTFNNLNYSANILSQQSHQVQNSELLSLTEYSALENFLDSIANDQSLSNLSKHWPSIDPMSSSSDKVNNYKRSNDDEATVTAIKLEDDQEDDGKLHMVTSAKPKVKQTRKQQQQSDSTKITKPTKQKQRKLKQEQQSLVDISNNSESSSETDNNNNSSSNNSNNDNNNNSNYNSKRSSLTNAEKKLNHISSEQKRRAVIKTAFDELICQIEQSPMYLNRLSKTGTKSKRKSMSKFNVMNQAVEEIERLIEINGKLRSLVGESNGAAF